MFMASRDVSCCFLCLCRAEMSLVVFCVYAEQRCLLLFFVILNLFGLSFLLLKLFLKFNKRYYYCYF